MASAERSLIDQRLANLRPEERRFRINAGLAWTGDALRVRTPRVVTLRPGDVLLRRARAFRGAPAGWPDLAGWDAVTVTPEMVGQLVAVAAGEEVKATGRLSRLQRLFRDCLLRMGGRYRVMRPARPGPRTGPASRARGRAAPAAAGSA